MIRRALSPAGPLWSTCPASGQYWQEFARLLRPGGDLVISDLRHELLTRGSVIKARGPAGEPCIAATCRTGSATTCGRR